MILDETMAIRIAELFQTLSDPSRVRIISALLEGEMNIGPLSQTVGLSQSAVSHQMRGLRQTKMVRSRKAGRQVFYSLDDQHVAELFKRGVEHVSHD
jgi:DNA-binding transcriptional ArsR family regulator